VVETEVCFPLLPALSVSERQQSGTLNSFPQWLGTDSTHAACLTGRHSPTRLHVPWLSSIRVLYLAAEWVSAIL